MRTLRGFELSKKERLAKRERQLQEWLECANDIGIKQLPTGRTKGMYL